MRYYKATVTIEEPCECCGQNTTNDIAILYAVGETKGDVDTDFTRQIKKLCKEKSYDYKDTEYYCDEIHPNKVTVKYKDKTLIYVDYAKDFDAEGEETQAIFRAFFDLSKDEELRQLIINKPK